MSLIDTDNPPEARPLRVGSDVPFYLGLTFIGGTYILLLLGMLFAEMTHTSPAHIWKALQTEEVQYSIELSLLSCGITTLLSVWVAVPIGYLMSRHEFRGKALIDSVLDIPIVLPPLVVGLCLLILFNSPAAVFAESLLKRGELFLADHLLPALWLVGLVFLGFAALLLLRRWLPSLRLRVIAAGSLTAALFLGLTWSYLFPRLPEWVPVPERFEPVKVQRLDQSPLRASREVYRAAFSFHGTAVELHEALLGRFQQAGLPLPRLLGGPDELRRAGRRRYLVAAAEGDNKLPRNREILISCRPQLPPEKRQKTETNLTTEPVKWVVTFDVQRPAEVAEARIVPPLTFPVTMEIPAVILAQFMVACAFAVRTMRVTFDQLSPRFEQVALTLGCNRAQAFWRVVLPQCRRGMLAAGTLAWARALGEFGPILIFAGSTRMKTEVLSTTVFLELTVGNIEGAVAASLIMILAAIIVLVLARVLGLKRTAF